MAAGGNDRAIVDQRHLPSPDLAGAGDGVVKVGESDARIRAGNYVPLTVRQYDVTASLERDPMLNEFQFCGVSSRVERNTPRIIVIDDAAQRQHSAVSDGHQPGSIIREGCLINNRRSYRI